MSTEAFFTQAFVYLTAAVVAVPIAKRVGLGSVLGYLLAGIVIGPFVLGLVGAEGEDVMHFAEFGVVMMLFVIGLELEPSLLWRLRAPILGLGGLQVGAIDGPHRYGDHRHGCSGFEWQAARSPIGMIVALSSTAIVLQTLAEKGLHEEHGRPERLLRPPLPRHRGHPDAGPDAPSVDWQHVELSAVTNTTRPKRGSRRSRGGRSTLAVLGAVAGIIVIAGRYLLRPFFRDPWARSASGRSSPRPSLLLVIGIALLMTPGRPLSPALGTFLAGVVLANSEYRHELEADIEPFKGLLLGLFFISVGASIDFGGDRRASRG